MLWVPKVEWTPALQRRDRINPEKTDGTRTGETQTWTHVHGPDPRSDPSRFSQWDGGFRVTVLNLTGVRPNTGSSFHWTPVPSLGSPSDPDPPQLNRQEKVW